MEFKYKLSSSNAIDPIRCHSSAGWDLYSSENVLVPANIPTLVQTGIKIQYMSEGWVGFIKQKSGNALKKGWNVYGGVIDCDYRGNIGVILVCPVDTEITRGMAIAQLVFLKIPNEVTMVKSEDEDVTTRMNDGFGSTYL